MQTMNVIKSLFLRSRTQSGTSGSSHGGQHHQHLSKEDREILCVDAPEEYGLMITLLQQQNQQQPETSSEIVSGETKNDNPDTTLASSANSSTVARLELVPDQPLKHVHPHAYGPASLHDTKKLGGGGSGITVFAGTDMELGELVMKHGTDKDTKELFALASIAEELQQRRSNNTTNVGSELSAEKAFVKMSSMIPQFRAIYISPRHLWKRPNLRQVWGKALKSVLVSRTSSPTNGKRKINKYRFSLTTNGGGGRRSHHKDDDDEEQQQMEILFPKEMLEGEILEDSTHRRSTVGGSESWQQQQQQDWYLDSTRSIPSMTAVRDDSYTSNSNTTAQIATPEESLRRSRPSTTTLGESSTSNRSFWSFTTRSSDGCSGASSGRSGGKAQEQSEEERRRCKPIQLFATKRDVDIVKVSSSHSKNDKLGICLGNDTKVLEDSATTVWYGLPPHNGYQCLKSLIQEFMSSQKKHGWKVTLAQRKIGGSTTTSPKTAAKYLSEGCLEGKLLDILIEEELQVIRNLQALTTEEEASLHISEQLRKEIDNVHDDVYFSPMDLSNQADEFVGMAIKKNWNPATGRFFNLRRMGEAFRDQKLYVMGHSVSQQERFQLMKEEEIPAYYLGLILRDGAKMSDVFDNYARSSCQSVTAMDSKGCAIGSWMQLLKDATSLKSSTALKRVWNCGLADGGLHNMFLTPDDPEGQNLWLFDLGEPTFQPVPAFLTKFLFSFFHTLGMVDCDTGDGWVNRFVVPSANAEKSSTIADLKRNKLELTEESKRIIPKAYHAFKVTLDRFVEELFDGEGDVRDLLITYVTLQLLSDAAFCLDRWTTKGGGRARHRNHHKHIETWLWRSLWDIYIASDLCSKSRQRYLGFGQHRRLKQGWFKNSNSNNKSG